MIGVKRCNMLWEISYTCLCFAAQVMKNIFHQSFNAYKTDIEPRLNDVTLRNMQCSRRLFEIQLSHRRISAAYIEGDNVAVIVEGEAARVLNFDTGTHMYKTTVIALQEIGGEICPWALYKISTCAIFSILKVSLKLRHNINDCY